MRRDCCFSFILIPYWISDSVIKLMQSLKSAWMHYYWFFTDKAIEFLRNYCCNTPSATPISPPLSSRSTICATILPTTWLEMCMCNLGRRITLLLPCRISLEVFMLGASHKVFVKQRADSTCKENVCNRGGSSRN